MKTSSEPKRVRGARFKLICVLVLLAVMPLARSQAADPDRPRLANISTRGVCGAHTDALIGGFIITGPGAKKLLLRAIGPSLPLAESLEDPDMAIYEDGIVGENDDWRQASNRDEIAATGLAPSNLKESAFLGKFPERNYSAVIYPEAQDPPGFSLMEIYDIDATVDAELANLSTRAQVGAGDKVLIGGFIIQGNGPLKVIVRAIGPTMPIGGTLGDPTLELRNGNGDIIGFNDNWRSSQEEEIKATTIPPKDDRESALVRTLDPGAYTAIIRGVNDATGLGLFEVYALH